MTAAGNERARLDARSAELREKVDELLGDFTARTEALRQAQQAAAAVTATLTSKDGLVRVSVDATGLVTELHIAATAFDHTRPDTLSRTISDLLRQATIQVRRQTAELMRPIREGLPDLSAISDDAPKLDDMLPKIPQYPAPEPNSAQTAAPGYAPTAPNYANTAPGYSPAAPGYAPTAPGYSAPPTPRPNAAPPRPAPAPAPPPAPPRAPAPVRAPAPQRRPASADAEDDMPATWMQDGY